MIVKLLAICVALVGCSGNVDVTQNAPAIRDPDVVVFMGDSITYRWFTYAIPSLGMLVHQSIDAGVSGETSQQMLARFNGEVIDSVASTVVILAGTNDVLHGSEDTQYVKQMALSAKDVGMRVILCKIPPTHVSVTAWNKSIEEFAESENFELIDYSKMRPDQFSDGIHPNQAGYKYMWSQLGPLL